VVAPYCYTYDGNGIRVQKANASGGSCTGTPTVDVLYWRNIGGNTIAETDSTGSTSNANYHEYVFFAGRRVARSDVSSASVYYYFVDHLGSTRIMTQANGTVCFDAEYFPYGQELDHTNTCNTINTTYKFTGYERDGETGLDYAFARYYNDRLGRFMSGDPLGGGTGDPQSLNRYAYVSNNPVNLIDPSGMDGLCAAPTSTSICVSAPFPDPGPTGPASVGGDFGLGGSGNGGGQPWPVGCEYSRLCMCHWRDNCGIVFPSPTRTTTQPLSTPPTPPSPPQPPSQVSWWGTFIKTFATNLVSSEFWSQEMSAGGCLNSFSEGADKVDVLKELTAVPNLVEDTIRGATADVSYGYASTFGVLGTGLFTASHALSCPGCSATFRTVVGAGGKAAEGFGAVYLFGQTVAGSVKEYRDLLNGTCR
jgi:RHS repeat-associated protein